MSAAAGQPRPRPGDRARPGDRRRRRGVARGMVLLLVAVSLLVGVLVGYVAHGDDAPAGLVTQSREVPTVTVTVPSRP